MMTVRCTGRSLPPESSRLRKNCLSEGSGQGRGRTADRRATAAPDHEARASRKPQATCEARNRRNRSVERIAQSGKSGGLSLPPVFGVDGHRNLDIHTYI